jgi:hypothetical protein
MSSLKYLMCLLPPPPEALESEDAVAWDRVERSLGTELPLDYKELLATYGSGAVDGFLWILNPFAKNHHLNLIHEGRAKLEALAALIHETVPYPLYPNPNGLLPCAVTDNGDVMFWICSGHPSEWNLAINEGRGPRWREYKLSLTDFLIRLISRELIVDLFPNDFPSNQPVFIQYKVGSK